MVILVRSYNVNLSIFYTQRNREQLFSLANILGILYIYMEINQQSGNTFVTLVSLVGLSPYIILIIWVCPSRSNGFVKLSRHYSKNFFTVPV